MYHSPSSKPDYYINNLEHVLTKLNRHNQKQIILVGDTNIDIIKYEHDQNSINLINTTSSHGYVQLIARPTCITDHSVTLIDHIYTNSPYNVTAQNIITLDISDHLGTYVNLVLDNKNERMNCSKILHENKQTDYYKINDENMQKFVEYISAENWDTVHNAVDAQTKYDQFILIYTKHYDSAFLTKPTENRRKNQRNNPKPWI